MQKPALRYLFLLLALSWAILIYYLSSQPGLDAPPLFPLQDKLFHLIVFGVLGFFGMGAMEASVHGHKVAQVWGIIILVTLYGILDEFHQRYVPGRTAEIYDVIADVIGGVLGAWTMYFLVKTLCRRASEPQSAHYQSPDKT